MRRVYLDIETYTPSNALDVRRVVAIGVREGGANRIFNAWEDERRAVVESMLYVAGATVVGYNILSYDIPVLIRRAHELGVADLQTLMRFWYSLHIVDLMQIVMWRFGRRMRLEDALKQAGCQAERFGTGADVRQWVEEGRYDLVAKHLESDLAATEALDRCLTTQSR